MTYDKQIYPLIIVMTIIVLAVETLTLSILYNTSFDKQRDQLVATAASQAALITSVAKFDLLHSQTDNIGGAYGATLLQVRDAYNNFEGFGTSGELVIATLKGKKIEYLIRSRHIYLPEHLEPTTTMGSDKAVPMQKALSQTSGTIIARDYTGNMTLSAYEYIKPLNYGLVVKVDIDELRAPFIQVGIISITVAIILIVIGAFVFNKITHPMVQRLQESETLLEKAQSLTKIGHWKLILTTNIFTGSDELYNIFGLSRDEVAIESFIGVFHPDDKKTNTTIIKRAIEYGESWNVEHRLVCRDGTEKWVHAIGKAITDDMGNTIELIGTTQDISDRKNQKEEIERLALIVRNSSDFIGIADIEGQVLFLNDAGRKLVGLEDDEQLNNALVGDFFPDNAQGRITNEIMPALMSKDVGRWSGEINFRHFQSGHEIPVWYDIFRIDDPKTGLPINFATVTQDISEQKRSNDLLNKEKNRANNYLDIAGVMIIAIDDKARVTLVNKKGCEILGYKEDEIIGKNWFTNCLPENIRSEIKGVYASLMRGEIDFVEFYESPILTKMGNERVIAWQNTILRNGEGKIIGTLSSGNDVTELNKYRENLEDLVDERTQELHDAHEALVRKGRLATLGQLTATVSHELRNPLGAMRPSLYVVKKKSDQTDERLQNAIERIDRNIDRCDRIIDELLDFTRITDLKKDSIRFDEWIESVIDDQIIPKGIQVKKYLCMKNTEVDIDTGRLRRAVINVFDNSCHSMMDDNQKMVKNEEATIMIKSLAKDNRVEIIISDKGAGISEKVLAKIFEPLFSTKGFGVGLGMPVVKQIIEQHGGGIDIKSKEGEGTTVTLWLPNAK